jgi:lysophospholipase L1-like esterase
MGSRICSLAFSFAFLAACADTGEEAPPVGGSAGLPAGGAGAGGLSGSTAGGGGGGTLGGGSGTGGSSAGLRGSGATSGGSAGARTMGGGSTGIGSTGSSGAGGEGGAAEPSLTSFRVAVIGSSTAAGEGASSASRGWVSLLAASLEDAVVGDFTVVNLAMGGYTSVELLPDSGANGSIDDAVEREPNLIVVSLAGSNDLSAGTSTSTFMARLTSIRDAAVDAGIPVFFVSTAPKDLSTSERETLRDWAAEIGTRFSTCWVPGGGGEHAPCFVDIFEPLADASLGVASEYGAGDGIHLNDAGHAAIHEVALAVVEPYICSMTACR